MGVSGGYSPPKPSFGDRKKCDLCTKLGAGGENHQREWCYIDPKSKVYRPEVRARRVAQAKQRGLAIPPKIDINDAPSSNNLIANLEAVVGLIGAAGDQKQSLVD